MNKLVQAAEYYISLATTKMHAVEGQVVLKLKTGQTDTELHELFAEHDKLEAIINGLRLVQLDLGEPVNTKKSFDRRKALRVTRQLQKELANLWFDSTEAVRPSIALARAFVALEVRSSDNVGLAIMDQEHDSTQQMAVVEGDGGLFDRANPTHAPEYAPSH